MRNEVVGEGVYTISEPLSRVYGDPKNLDYSDIQSQPAWEGDIENLKYSLRVL